MLLATAQLIIQEVNAKFEVLEWPTHPRFVQNISGFNTGGPMLQEPPWFILEMSS